MWQTICAETDAIEFARAHAWFDGVVPRCAALLDEFIPELLEATGGESIYGSPDLRPPQMASFRLASYDAPALHSDLYQKHQIEAPLTTDDHGTFLRVSVQAYNEASDLESGWLRRWNKRSFQTTCRTGTPPLPLPLDILD